MSSARLEKLVTCIVFERLQDAKHNIKIYLVSKGIL